MQFFSYFYFSLTDCFFTVFYKLLLPFSAYAGRLRRSNCRFLLNSMKYKKLEEKPRPRGYNRIIKRKPNSNGERSVHYVIHYHFYCSHLRKYVLHAQRKRKKWRKGIVKRKTPCRAVTLCTVFFSILLTNRRMAQPRERAAAPVKWRCVWN